MFIYVGNRYEAAFRGYRWKSIRCRHCQLEWAYKMVCTADGEGRSPYFLDNDGAKQRAQQDALKNLDWVLDNGTWDVPCPQCGFYQPEMIDRLRKKRYEGHYKWGASLLAVGGTGALVVGLWLLSQVQSTEPIEPIVVIAAALGMAALVIPAVAVLGLRRRGLRRHDPNADADSRAGRPALPESDLLTRKQYEALVAAADPAGENQVPKIEWAAS
jgi:hypothetical protein